MGIPILVSGHLFIKTPPTPPHPPPPPPMFLFQKKCKGFCFSTLYDVVANPNNIVTIWWSFSYNDAVLLVEEIILSRWRHQIETFSAVLPPFVRGIRQSPANSPHKGQWRGALMVSLRLNKRLSNPYGRRWFETSSDSLWRHCNVWIVRWSDSAIVILVLPRRLRCIDWLHMPYICRLIPWRCRTDFTKCLSAHSLKWDS